MALEFGSGTQADPYLLVNLADVQALFTSYLTSGKYFALVASLDLSATQIAYSNSTQAIFHLDGRGYELKVSLRNNNGSPSYIFYSWGAGTLTDVAFRIIHTGRYRNAGTNPGFTLSNAVIEFSSDNTGTLGDLLRGTDSLIIGGNTGIISGSNVYKDGSEVSNTINTASFADGNKYNKANYPGFDEAKWIFDGISLPRPRPQATADLTNRYGVKGQSKVGSNGQQRNVAVFTENGLRYKLQSTKTDGTFFINLNDVATPVILLVHDDIGAKLVANTAYALNQIIHPATPNGYRYRCTLAGNSGATLPAEPWPTSAVLTAGAAQFTPEPVFEPKAHGPLLPVLFNVLTETPV
ncbi:hypothetical protein [Aeromonas hydrophila]|uniref:hypothetical protein n=1 Tax=Aeromonas hydrophila TaxID=644 RepID=UPI000CC4251E|nr:hypothetical protein [Aeromonas hydrophila]PKD25292.1 hypothetical protein AO056_01350 [Aeromonas hydrophila]